VSASIIAAVALIAGETPKRSDAKMRSGSVVVPAPATKNEVRKSSNENVNASRPPASTAGVSRGSVTWRNVDSGPAPRSYEASSSECPMPMKRARTTSATTDALKTTCATRIDQKPSGDSTPTHAPTWTKKMSAEIPNTISGVTSVMYASASIGTRSQARIRGSASASIVPSTHATTALPAAISTELRSGSVIVGSRSASPNHRVENPSQISTCRPPLNA
jgi:hypothetical protein